MWHTSVSHPDAKIRAQVARKVVKGLGSEKLGEWREQGQHVFHLRRRLTIDEEETVGAVKDLRGTQEGSKRLEAFCYEMQRHPKYSMIIGMALAELQSAQSPIIVT